MDRSNISVAQPEIAKQFRLNKTSMGLVLAAFTWAYALGQVPAGWLGDRFGPKKVLAVIMSWWALAAAMTGAALGLYSLFSARFLLGLGEAGAFPMASRGMQLWFPRRNADAFKAPRISSAASRWPLRRSLRAASCWPLVGERSSTSLGRWASSGPSLFHFFTAIFPKSTSA